MKAITRCLFLAALCTSSVAQNQQEPARTVAKWVLRFDGIGAVRVGMTLSQLNAALREKFSMPKDKEEQACFYVEPEQHPDTAIMIVDGRVARVDVFAPNNAVPSTANADGVRLGDSEARVKGMYGPRVEVSPHAYTDGHYLTIRSGDYGMRFETGEGKVTSFYSGRINAITFIEGCQ